MGSEQTINDSAVDELSGAFGTQDAPVKSTKLDPEDDRANWPTIRIDDEEGKPNYEFLGAHGTKEDGSPFGHELQVMRGVDVQVPPSIVYMLRDAVSTHFTDTKDPVTGKIKRLRTDRKAIPWTLVKQGNATK